MKLKKNTLPFVPLYHADFLGNTHELTGDEFRGYLLLVIHFWINGPLSNNKAMLDRIARTDSALLVEMYFRPDEDGRLIPPDFADLKEQALNNAAIQRNRTSAAREASIESRRKSSVTQNSSVTQGEGEGEGEGDLYGESESESSHSVTEKFSETSEQGRPTDGRQAPRVASTPQTSVRDVLHNNLSQHPIFFVEDGKKRKVIISPERMAKWKEKFPLANHEVIVRTWSSKSKGEPFSNSKSIVSTLEDQMQAAQEKMSKKRAA